MCKKYESLLYRIANSLGFYDREAMQLVEETYRRNAQFNEEVYQSGARIALTRTLVRQCIFRISSTIFSKPTLVTPGRVPLSFQTVYILFHMFGFDEREIAQILNVNALLVKERLGRAAQLIKCDEATPDKAL